MHLLVLGTHNRKKGHELAQLLAPFGFDLKTLADFSGPLEVEETGESFAENAALKAVQQARHMEAWVLGEDSGLCVDALGGKPGIHSARFAGPHATDELNNIRLLEDLDDVPNCKRSAHYVCHVTLADPRGEVRANCQSTCCGKIRHSPVGTGGFGYDPLFGIAEYHRTFAEMGASVKSVLSHRARAMRRLIPEMVQIARSGHWDATTSDSEVGA